MTRFYLEFNLISRLKSYPIKLNESKSKHKNLFGCILALFKELI